MILEINDKTTLRQIQETFSNYYPYLKIEFYSRAHKKYEASDEISQIEPNILIGDIKGTHVDGLLEVLPQYKVCDIEKEFKDRFGLSVQIFRKEKNNWEQTRAMDDFTLRQLSEFGRNSADDLIVSEYEEGFIEPEDKPEKLF